MMHDTTFIIILSTLLNSFTTFWAKFPSLFATSCIAKGKRQVTKIFENLEFWNATEFRIYKSGDNIIILDSYPWVPPPLPLYIQQNQHHSPQKSKTLPHSRAKKISAILSDVATEVTELHHLLLDPYSSNCQKLFTLTSIKATIIPFICAASVKISASTNNFPPISGENYVHKINEAKRKSNTELNENWEKKSKS